MAWVPIESLSTLGEGCRVPTDNGRPARDHPSGGREGIRMRRKFIHPAVATGAAVAVTVMMTAAAAGSAPHASGGPRTTTPIKHVVVIIGENHSFDNVFATYQPPRHQKIWNLLSEGIVTKSGPPARTSAKPPSSPPPTPRPTASTRRSPELTSSCRGPTPPTCPRPATA
jgi:hypothetical protein